MQVMVMTVRAQVTEDGALDDLYSLERKENERKENAVSSDLYSESKDNNAGDGNDSESSGNRTWSTG